MKYNINNTYTTKNDLVVSVSQTGSKSMIRMKGEDKATLRQGYRVIVSGETISMGDWNESEQDVLFRAIKRERYAHLAYKEAYYDLLEKLASIGFSQIETEDGE